jgi:hypothetical protein
MIAAKLVSLYDAFFVLLEIVLEILIKVLTTTIEVSYYYALILKTDLVFMIKAFYYD